MLLSGSDILRVVRDDLARYRAGDSSDRRNTWADAGES
jgi:hypothetical protein